MCLNIYFQYYNFKSLCVSYTFIFCLFIYTTTAYRCGEYGFVCLNNEYYKKCDTKFVRESEKEVVYKCPENTVCNERYQRACDLCQVKKINNELELKADVTDVTSEEQALATSLITTPIPYYDHSTKNMSAVTARITQNSMKTKTFHKVAERRVKRQFFCPQEGAFPDKVNGNNKYFYICYRDPRSKNYQSLPVQCPDGMAFDQKNGRCVNTYGKKIIIYKFPHKRKNPLY